MLRQKQILQMIYAEEGQEKYNSSSNGYRKIRELKFFFFLISEPVKTFTPMVREKEN